MNEDEVFSTKVNSVTQINKTSTISNAYLVADNKNSLPAPSNGDFINSDWESLSSNYTATSSLGVWVYVTVSGENNWEKLGLDIDGEANGDQSGISVSLNSTGDIVAIGAPYNDETDINSGHVRVYQNVNGTWTQLGEDIDGEAIYDYSGDTVSLNSTGDIVAIGAPYNNGNDTSSGHVRVYTYRTVTNTEWNDTNENIIKGITGNPIYISSPGSITNTHFTIDEITIRIIPKIIIGDSKL